MIQAAGVIELSDLKSMVRAAGGVVFRRNELGIGEVLLVHRPGYDDWSFPKGKLDPGESYEDCALREVSEETGLRCKLLNELEGTTYFDRRGRPKIVRYWAMKALDGKFVPSDEVDEAEWVSIIEATDRLTYSHDRELVESLVETRLPHPVLILRHGAAGDRSTWQGPDQDRPLTKKGRRQAEAIVDLYAPYGVARILSSPYLRCVQTVEPLSDALGVEIELSDKLAEGAVGAAKLAAAASRESGGAVVLCTHGDIIWDLTGGGPAAKASTWVLVAGKKGLKSDGFFGPPDV